MPWDADDELERAIQAARPRVPDGFADAVARRISAAQPAPRPAPAPTRAVRRRWLPMATAGALAAAAATLLLLRAPAAHDLCVVTESGVAAAPVGARLRDQQALTVPTGGELRVTCDQDHGGEAYVRLYGGSIAVPQRRDLLLERGTARIEGNASVTTTWARVAGLDPDALVEIQLSTEESSMNATAVTGVILAATAGSVLTVHVIRGDAEVRRTSAEAPVLALRSGDSASVPAEGPVQVARGTAPMPVAAAPTLPSRPLFHPPLGAPPPTPAPPAGDCESEGECDPSECDGQPPADCEGEDCSHCEMMVEAEPPTAEPRVTVEIEGAPSLGRADARVVIVEFGDFQCPFCERAMSSVHALAEMYPNDVRIVFKNFPLPNHKRAALAAEAALAAGDQGKYWEMYDLLFANRENLDRASLETYAQQLGLDLPRFRRALDQHVFAARVADDTADATAVGIQGIPTFLINGRVVQGALPLEQLKAIVEEELRR